MKTEIVWVNGPSGAGKETFIGAALRAELPQHVLDALGWQGREIVACMESIEWIAGQRDGDATGDKRKKLIDVALDKAARHPGAIILVKSQDLDLKADRPRFLWTMTPGAVNRIVYLRCELEEQFARWYDKWWFNPAEHTMQTVVEWQREQTKMLLELQRDGFEIIAFDGGAGKNYAPTSLPPL